LPAGRGFAIIDWGRGFQADMCGILEIEYKEGTAVWKLIRMNQAGFDPGAGPPGGRPPWKSNGAASLRSTITDI